MKSSMAALVCCATSILILAQTENSSCKDLDTGSTTLYKDVFSGDVMFSGKHRKKLLDGVIYEVHGNIVTARKVDLENVDFIIDHNLKEVVFHGKKNYLHNFKKYMSKVEARLQELSPDQVDTFKSNVNNVMRDLLRRFSNFRFFTGQSSDIDAMIVLMEYKDVDEVRTPVLYAFKHGLVEATHDDKTYL